MLKVGRKRSFDSLANSPHYSPAQQPVRERAFHASPYKRQRKEEPKEQTINTQEPNVNPAFPKSNFSTNNVPKQKWLEWTPQRRRKHLMKTTFSSSEKIFTFDDVRAFIEKAVQEKEESLRAEYTQILEERLQGT